MEAVVNILAYMGQKYNSRLVYDQIYPEIDCIVFKKCDWTQSYQDANDAIPMNVQGTRGKEVDTCMFVDSDLVENKKIAFLICVSTALVQWYSKSSLQLRCQFLELNLCP